MIIKTELDNLIEEQIRSFDTQTLRYVYLYDTIDVLFEALDVEEIYEKIGINPTDDITNSIKEACDVVWMWDLIDELYLEG